MCSSSMPMILSFCCSKSLSPAWSFLQSFCAKSLASIAFLTSPKNNKASQQRQWPCYKNTHTHTEKHACIMFECQERLNVYLIVQGNRFFLRTGSRHNFSHIKTQQYLCPGWFYQRGSLPITNRLSGKIKLTFQQKTFQCLCVFFTANYI